MQFIEKPASNSSLSRRKLIYGVGINDAGYLVSRVINKKKVCCPFYRRWFDMLRRCYSAEYHALKPTYLDCSACNEWLTFSNFKAWMIKQDWQGNHLDKDILNQGNKTYSPSTCIFVTRDINALLVDQKSTRGIYPQGVYFNKKYNTFSATISINGKKKTIGYFPSSEIAFTAYKKAKYTLIAEIARSQAEPLSSALLKYKL